MASKDEQVSSVRIRSASFSKQKDRVICFDVDGKLLNPLKNWDLIDCYSIGIIKA